MRFIKVGKEYGGPKLSVSVTRPASERMYGGLGRLYGGKFCFASTVQDAQKNTKIQLQKNTNTNSNSKKKGLGCMEESYAAQHMLWQQCYAPCLT